MKIGIVGCCGRMGGILVAEVLTDNGLDLAGGTEQPGSEWVGLQIGDMTVGDDPKALFEVSDTVIDFTQPDATLAHAALAAETGTAMVIGTTGLTDTHMQGLKDAAAKTVIVQAANMSVGVNLLLGLTERTAAALGDEYDIEIVEMHHRHKVDAPSGTALALGRAAADGRGVDLESVSQRARDGHTGERTPGDIGFATLRGGDIAGDHTVIFAGDGERIELAHKASDRAVFARGAVRAARWCEGQKPGLYSMRDVLGLG